jgi:TatD DNase family protein
MLFDTHFHLDLVENPSTVALEIERQKIYTIAVTNLPTLFSNTENLCRGLKYVRPALGYHPELAFRYNNHITLFSELLNQTRYIGEVGLDKKEKPDDDYIQQKKIFEKIVSLCAEKKNKILTVHSRKAETDVLSILGVNFPGKVIFHWYSGSLANLERAISNGFYFSINIKMIQSTSGRKIINILPHDRILLETDAPFTNYQGKPCFPQTTSIIASEILKIKSNDEKMTNLSFETNFKRLLQVNEN